MSRTDFWPFLERIQDGEALTTGQARDAFGTIMSGGVAEDDLADFLIALSKRNPTIAEIVGAAGAMRASMLTVDAPSGAIDLCGTGGDGHGTLNISTATAFVVAANGVPVAKHGNRSASSRAGTADVLELLGVKIDMEPRAAEAMLRETNFCFLFAPHYHSAMKHVGSVRKQLGIRTIFNLLGPLCNPAGVTRQLMGVFAAEWVEPLAHVLKELGTQKAWLVHGADGLDELTTTAATHVAKLSGDRIERSDVSPEEIGLPRVPLSAIRGGDAPENAAALRRLLDGERGPFRDIVVLNAAAALIVADKAKDLKAGAALAAQAIDSGASKDVLARVAMLSRKAAA